MFQPQSHLHNPAIKYRKVRSTYLPANLHPPTQSIERPSSVLSRRKPNPIDRHRMGKDNKPLRAFWLAVKGNCEQVKTRPEKVLPVSYSQAKLRFAVLCSLTQLIILCCWNKKSPSSTMVQPRRSRPTVTFLRIGEQGRLGNQIFQIAATIGLAEKHSYAWGFFPNIQKSAVGRLFQLKGTLVPGKDLIDLQYSEKSEIYYDAFLPVGESTSIISLTGYFQDYRYFVNHLDVLNNCLKFPGSMIHRVEKKVPEVRSPFTVALHVRRGDYLKLNELYNVLDEGYYIRALLRIHSRVDNVIIVTDDRDWCRKHLEPRIPHKVIYSPFRDELSDFVLLHLSKTLIIANSSFSWWAAFLKHVRSRKLRDSTRIFAPASWYNVSGQFAYMNRDSFLPPDWTRVAITNVH